MASDEQIVAIRAGRAEGLSARQIADAVSLSEDAVKRIVKKERITLPAWARTANKQRGGFAARGKSGRPAQIDRLT